MSLVKASDSSVLYSQAVELKGHEEGASVLSSKFSPSGECIASAGTDRAILLWDLPRAEGSGEFSVLGRHQGAVTLVRWIDDNTLVSGSADTTVALWDLVTGKRIRKLDAHSLCINEVAVDVQNQKSENYILSVLDDGWACLWDQREKTPFIEIETEYPILLGAINDDTIIFGGIESTLKAFDIRKPKDLLWECDGPAGEAITSISLADDLAAVRGLNGTISTYLIRSFVPEGIPRATSRSYVGAPLGKEKQLIRCAFNPEKSRLILGSEDKSVTIWEFSSLKISQKLDGHLATTIDVDWNNKYNIIVSSSLDGSIIVREL